MKLNHGVIRALYLERKNAEILIIIITTKDNKCTRLPLLRNLGRVRCIQPYPYFVERLFMTLTYQPQVAMEQPSHCVNASTPIIITIIILIVIIITIIIIIINP